jgi:hypothetical protein
MVDAKKRLNYQFCGTLASFVQKYPVLGISVKRWNQAPTGNFEKLLAEVKQRVDQIESIKK